MLRINKKQKGRSVTKLEDLEDWAKEYTTNIYEVPRRASTEGKKRDCFFPLVFGKE